MQCVHKMHYAGTYYTSGFCFTVGVICAAPMLNGWYRAQISAVCEESDECDIKYVDYGGFSRVQGSALRQIRWEESLIFILSVIGKWINRIYFQVGIVSECNAVFLILFDRSDFMTLPFQACECYMANITPLQGMRLKQCWKRLKIYYLQIPLFISTCIFKFCL